MNDHFVRDLEGVHNYRPVAGYALAGGGRLRGGQLFRAGALELMTDSDYEFLDDEAGIWTVLDLRHPDEFPAGHSHPLQSRVQHISIFPDGKSQADLIAELNGLYGTGPTPRRYMHYLQVGGPQFAAAFRLFGDEGNYPILTHCTAGKDRTGVLLGMVLEVIGVSPEDNAHEYGLSDASIPRLIAYLESTGRQLEGTREEIAARLATPADRMAGFLELLQAEHGGAERYLRSQGVEDEVFDRVRAILAAR
ncbi:MAG: tyrosine-protein phosphatase [Dehalococcoidia bacterium]